MQNIKVDARRELQVKTKPSAPPSKLSKGVKNDKHKTFEKNERLIEQSLHKAIETRTISVRAKDICETANISSPTFYLHYRNVDAALFGYENKLEQKFQEMLPNDLNKEIRFTILLKFIGQYNRYFAACFTSQNFYLVMKLIQLTRPNLAQTKINQKAYIVYANTVVGVLICFGKFEKFSSKAVPLYAKKLANLRIMDYGL